MPDDFETWHQKLFEISPKAARAFRVIGEELWRELPSDLFGSWFNFGALISYSSSANGIKFFNESGEIARKFSSHSSFISLLETGIRLSFADNSMALEFFRRIPDLISHFSPEEINSWAETGKQIAGEDYLTGSEYFKAGPLILPVLDLPLLEPWAKIGLLLSKADRENKTYLTLDYFRTSPEILGQVKDPALFYPILKIGHALALQAPKETPGFFKAIPAIFQNLQQEEGSQLIFSLATDLSFEAPGAVVDFLTHATDLLKMMNGNFTSLKRFVETGFEMKSHPEAVKSFFALKSKKSVELIQELTHMIFLSEIRRQLVYYAEMVTGLPVEIIPGILPSSRIKNRTGTIVLPEKINVYRKREDNYKLYKLMALHEAVHIEFGSYDPVFTADLEEIRALFPERRISADSDLPVWQWFPDPVLAQNLWTIAEESRIDYLLRTEYPGAIRDLEPILLSQKANRPDLFNLPEEKAILEALFQLSIHQEIVVPLPIANFVSQMFSLLKNLWHPRSTIHETLQTVCVMYRHFQKEVKRTPLEKKKPDLISWEDPVPNYGTIPQSSFSHHGLITPDLSFQSDSAPVEFSRNLNMTEKQQRLRNQGEALRFRSPETEKPGQGVQKSETGPENAFLYHEWDWMSQNYKPQWCRLIEKRIEPSLAPISGVETSPGSILSLRRYFEKLRPENYRKTRKEKEGEQIDLDQLIDVVVDIRAGVTPPENFYVKREKKERKISVAFLVDLSGSTGQPVSGGAKRIIDIEKESLRLMSEALNTIGDEYGIFGFSGQSRNQIEFYTLKDFDECNRTEFHHKMGALAPLKQNRDGTAIRHLIGKLFQREARIKLLIMISDGKPLDDDYRDLYALEDTKMALREARQKGIHPFCITVDQQANEYIKKMYQDVHFTFISDIQTLPLKLPQIYKKLTT